RPDRGWPVRLGSAATHASAVQSDGDVSLQDQLPQRSARYRARRGGAADVAPGSAGASVVARIAARERPELFVVHLRDVARLAAVASLTTAALINMLKERDGHDHS